MDEYQVQDEMQNEENEVEETEVSSRGIPTGVVVGGILAAGAGLGIAAEHFGKRAISWIRDKHAEAKAKRAAKKAAEENQASAPQNAESTGDGQAN